MNNINKCIENIKKEITSTLLEYHDHVKKHPSLSKNECINLFINNNNENISNNDLYKCCYVFKKGKKENQTCNTQTEFKYCSKHRGNKKENKKNTVQNEVTEIKNEKSLTEEYYKFNLNDEHSQTNISEDSNYLSDENLESEQYSQDEEEEEEED